MATAQINLPEGAVKIKRLSIKTDITKVVKVLEAIANES